MADDKNVNVAKEVGKYFYTKKQYAQAAAYFDKSLAAKADDIEAIELLLYSYAGAANYDGMYKKATAYIDLYPTQASLYYFAGMAANQQKQYAKAKEWLENGLDFVVDDADLEAGFKRELAIAKKAGS
jgi:tetratricopeptide (TPR) repeat protein